MIEKEISVTIGQATVEGNLTVPHNARGIVLFAHGSGSGRFSPRNQYVAKEFNKSRIGTLLFDLLTNVEEEEDLVTAEYRFNIPLLADRLVGATEWLKKSSITQNLKLTYFGASTGAAAALIAAAKLQHDIVTVVSRGGRPDLAEKYLPKVKAPTLLIVGGYDADVIELNKQAMAKMTAERKLVIIPWRNTPF